MALLSLLKKKWTYLSNNDPAVSEELSKSLNVHPVISRVLVNRGVDTEKKIKEFLSPSLEGLSDLENIPNIKSAAEFLLKVIDSGKKLAVYGDYDVDGVTGTTLLVSAFRQLGAKNLEYYIPHRFSEGYGLNKEAILKLHQVNVEVLVTVDCGISNYEEIKYAKELGMSVVVTDHHMPPVVYPDADYLVNPKLNNAEFAGRNISGVGVAFKIVEQMFRLKGFSPYSQTKKYLDLVLLGTIADIVPLLEENRILSVFGLQQINNRARVGIRALAEVAGLRDSHISTKDVGFGLAPRINAAGRMDDSIIALELMLEQDYHKARRIAERLNQLNSERQNIGLTIKEKVVAEIEKNPNKDNEKVFILASAGWHPGIIGIVASQIVKQYNRPTALIAISEKDGRGSVRSLDQLDIFEPLTKCAYLLKDFGGHKEAAGFEIELGKIEEFKEKFSRIINESLEYNELVPALEIDMPLKKEDITLQLAQEIEKLSPFGQDNPIPVFSTNELSIYDFNKVGDGKHLKLSLTDGERTIDAIAFNMGDMYDTLVSSSGLELAFNLSINEWQGKKKLQLIIKDFKVSE